MRIDGEPWKQPLPLDSDTVVVEISHFGQANMLVAPNCQSRSVLAPHSTLDDGDDDYDSDEEEDLEEESEERRKFGAANTFHYSDGLDDAQS